MKYQTLLKTTLLLTILAMATACSKPGSESSAEQASRVSPNEIIPGKSQYTECNKKSQSGISVSMMNYIDPVTDRYRDDYMKLKFLQMPSNFSTDGSYIQFYRWKANGNTAPSLDPVATKARFETLDGKVLTEFASTVSWSQIAKAAEQSKITDQATLFANVRLVVDIRDVNVEYDALKIVYYSSSNQVLINMDMLMPAFNVNPVEYAIDGTGPRSPNLQALHPFAGTTRATSDELMAIAKGFCFQ